MPFFFFFGSLGVENSEGLLIVGMSLGCELFTIKLFITSNKFTAVMARCEEMEVID